jgi:acyl carrier protein
VPEQQTAEQAVLAFVVGVLADITLDLDLNGGITSTTRLGDLGVESIALVYLIAEAQQRFGLEDLVFQALRQEERGIVDLQVGGLVELICGLLASRSRLPEVSS